MGQFDELGRENSQFSASTARLLLDYLWVFMKITETNLDSERCLCQFGSIGQTSSQFC